MPIAPATAATEARDMPVISPTLRAGRESDDEYDVTSVEVGDVTVVSVT